MSTETDITALRRLTPVDFERMIMRLLWRWGFYNVQRIGGSGDGGRDLTAQTIEYPLPGRQLGRSWIVQCKRWHSLPSKTHIRNGLDAASAHRADYYLLVGTFDLTPGFVDWLEPIRDAYRFDIIVAASDDLLSWLASAQDVGRDFLQSSNNRHPFTELLESLIEALGTANQPGPDLLATLSLAVSLCHELGTLNVGTGHLLLALNQRRTSLDRTVLEKSGLSKLVARTVFSPTSIADFPENRISPTPNALTVLREAASSAAHRGPQCLVDDLDLLAGLAEIDQTMATTLLRSGRVDRRQLYAHIASARESNLNPLSTPIASDLLR